MTKKRLLLFVTIVASAIGFQAQSQLLPKVTRFDWSQFTFDFTEDGENKTANLTDAARSTDHIIALLRAVYINENVPGIHYAYEFMNPETQEYSLHRKLDYGFNYTSHNTSYPGSSTNHGNSHGHGGGGSNNTWNRALDADILPIKNPVEDGMTVLLVQLKESWNKPVGRGDNNTARSTINKAWSSAQVVTAFTRVHDVHNPGYLYAIDGTATNKFFFISKGKSRGCSSSVLYRLYEQLSPVKGEHGLTTYDFISKMKSGQVYYCLHDCLDVTTYDGDHDSNGNVTGHWFTISNEGEAYSLKNLCLYVPDRRYENELRDEDPVQDGLSWYDDQAHYYTNYGQLGGNSSLDSIIRPKVLMYTANLNAEAIPSEVEDHYRVNLDWSTSFTDKKIGAHVPEHFYVYIVKEDGSWVRIDDLLGTPENPVFEPIEAHSGSYLVPQTYETQKFDYVITAHPINYDMDGNMLMDGMDTLNTDHEKPLVTITAVSPVRTVVIPPLGMPFFQRIMEYRSYYDVNREQNWYRNKISVMFANDDAFKSLHALHGSYEVTRTDPAGEKEVVAKVTLDAKQQEGQLTYNYHIHYVDPVDVANYLFDNGKSDTVGVIVNPTDELMIFDRFKVNTDKNEHYDHYIYNFEKVTVQGQGGETFKEVCSNPLIAPVFKTTNKVETEGYTKDDVLADKNHTLEPRPTNKVTFTANYDPSANLVEYDVLRVNRTHHPVDEYKVGKAENFDNSGEYHVIGIGEEGYLNYLEQTLNIGSDDEAQEITFVDKYGSVAEPVSSYVPTIITLFGGDQTKVNTYGCDIQDMSYPQLSFNISAEKSKSYRTVDENGNAITCKGYTATLQLKPWLTDEINFVYYYRIWRVVDGEETEVLLNELDDFSGMGTSPSGAQVPWAALYSTIQETYPGEEIISFNDIIVRPYNTEADDDFEVTYIARLYATYIEGYMSDVITPDHPRRATEHGGKDYVVVEQRSRVSFRDVPTYLDELGADQVKRVTYYNMQGIPSNRPYQGVNIVVTMYQNGRTVTTKEMR